MGEDVDMMQVTEAPKGCIFMFGGNLCNPSPPECSLITKSQSPISISPRAEDDPISGKAISGLIQDLVVENREIGVRIIHKPRMPAASDRQIDNDTCNCLGILAYTDCLFQFY